MRRVGWFLLLILVPIWFTVGLILAALQPSSMLETIGQLMVAGPLAAVVAGGIVYACWDVAGNLARGDE